MHGISVPPRNFAPLLQSYIAELTPDYIRILVLGDFPETEAHNFLLKHALEPELQEEVTDDAWRQMFEVGLLAKSRCPLVSHTHHSFAVIRMPFLLGTHDILPW